MVVFINRFIISGQAEEFERVFKLACEFMYRQPGFIRHRLVRSLRHPDIYFNIAEWDNAESLEHAVQQKEFQLHARELATVAQSDPNLYTTVFEYGSTETDPAAQADPQPSASRARSARNNQWNDEPAAHRA